MLKLCLLRLKLAVLAHGCPESREKLQANFYNYMLVTSYTRIKSPNESPLRQFPRWRRTEIPLQCRAWSWTITQDVTHQAERGSTARTYKDVNAVDTSGNAATHRLKSLLAKPLRRNDAKPAVNGVAMVRLTRIARTNERAGFLPNDLHAAHDID
jgi:hypothetical protein